MIITTSSVYKLIAIIRALAKESPLKRVSKNELEAAEREINNIKYENNKRECLNRALGHLESAYSHFTPSTWNFLDDEDRVLWDQRTYKNDICITIVIIHYFLGNSIRAKKWIEDELSEYGWIHIPQDAIQLIGFDDAKKFFSELFHDNGEKYDQLQWSTKFHFDQAFDDSGYNPLDASQNPYPF